MSTNPPFVVVLSLFGTGLFPESLREQWEEIVASATAVEDYAREGEPAIAAPTWVVARSVAGRIDRFVAGCAGVTGQDIAAALASSGIDDVHDGPA